MIVQMISDFVIDLLRSLDVPEMQLEELEVNMVQLSEISRQEDLMVYLSKISKSIIDGKEEYLL